MHMYCHVLRPDCKPLGLQSGLNIIGEPSFPLSLLRCGGPPAVLSVAGERE